MTEENEKSNALIVGALTHAREMALHASDIRMRNFNFFVVLIGVLITVYSQLKYSWVPMSIGAFGMIVSLLFLALDIRGRELLDRAMAQFEIAEDKLWNKAGLTPVQSFPQSSRFRITSHTFIYRVFYILVMISSLAITLLAIFFS